MDAIKRRRINGKFIGVKENINTFCVKKEFDTLSLQKASLSITALGLYFVEINGKRVGDNYLTPGFTSYNKLLQIQDYDITAYLKKGRNIIQITVNCGWYAGRFGLDNKAYKFGEKQCVLACINIYDKGGKREIITDGSWKARESYILNSGLYDGEIIDFTKKLADLNVEVFDIEKNILVNQICPCVKNKERLKVKKIINTPKGELVYDFGQNIAGVVEINLEENEEIVIQFGEILDEKGNFYFKNLRNAQGEARIKNDKKKRKVTFEFTYFGFRYVNIVTKNIEAKDIIAVARYSDLQQTGFLTVKNRKLNKFIQNVLWSQKDNFVDIPTDCPQRDERFGYTGDFNAFCTTAAYNYDIKSFSKKWLACLRIDQRKNGKMPIVTPDVMYYSMTISMWSDSAVMIPWKLYKQYGDISFLQDNYSMIKKYLKAKEKNCENGLITKGFEYGDWLALDGEEGYKFKIYGGTDIRFISNVFYYHCLKIATEIARILGKETDGNRYLQRAENLLYKIRNEYFTKTGRLAVPTITGHVLALVFGIVDDENKDRIAFDLNENVKKHEYHVITGFIGTPYLLFALADNGYWRTAEEVILNKEYPGWLYEVDMGATTVWERWNSLLPDGSPNPDGMTSFNHYAYGSMVEFLYRRIAGIENMGAGFDKITIMPHPVKKIGDVSCIYNSVKGKITSSFSYKGDEIIYEIEVPEKVNCQLKLPGEKEISLADGKHIFKRGITKSE